MIDFILADAHYIAPYDVMVRANKEVEFMGHIYLPNRGKGNELWIRNYTCNFNTFQIVLEPERIVVRNSLHKFLNGNNYSDFTFSQIQKSVLLIEKLTGISANDFKVRRLEFGVNTVLDGAANRYYDGIESYKTKSSNSMEKKGRCYGKKCQMTQYSVKVYSKTKMLFLYDSIFLKDEILRVEVAYDRADAIPGIQFLSDLTSASKLYRIGLDYMNKLNHINVLPNQDKLDYSEEELKLCYAGATTDYWKHLKRLCTLNRYKYLRKKYKVLVQGEKNKVKMDMIKMMQAKLDYLMAS